MSVKVKDKAEETVYLPKIPGESDTVWVARNGHSWNIPTGRQLRVPAVVADILRGRDASAEAAKAFERAEAERGKKAMTADGGEVCL